MITRITTRGRKVPRKPTDGYAELDCKAGLLKSLLAGATFQGKPLSIRTLSAKCGHKNHQHLMRLVNGQIKTTSEHTADIVEQFLGQPGNLFRRHPARSLAQFREDREQVQNIPAPRRAA